MPGQYQNAGRAGATGISYGERLCETCTGLQLDSILSNPHGSTVRWSQDTQFKVFAWENSTGWSRTCPLCNLFRLASGNREGDMRTPYALRFVARSLINAHDWGIPEMAHVIVKRGGPPVEVDREELRSRELGLLFLAVTKDHERAKPSASAYYATVGPVRNATTATAGDSRTGLTGDLTTDVRQFGMLSWLHGDSVAKNQGRGILIDPQKADLESVRYWLDYCEEHHNQCQVRSPPMNVEQFQLIDCTTHSIVAAPVACEYVALSYRWGQSSSSNSDTFMGKLLVQRLPKTISDAILATTRLGFRYLWIDRFCIPNDPRVKHAQISSMDIIYQNASATLIASSGDDAYYGLPGVGSRSRIRQSSLQIGNITLFTTPPHPATAIQEAAWMTRGWTFQEGIFLGDCMEALPPALDDWHTADKSSFLSLVDRAIFTVPTSSVGLTSLRLFASNYTCRSLSFPTDSLNAFLGVQAYFETLNSTIRHWWGVSFTIAFDLHSRSYIKDYSRLVKARIPGEGMFREARLIGRDRAETTLGPTPDTAPAGKIWNAQHCFFNALLWSHVNGNARRRSDFPSWSWVGWEGPISKLLHKDYFGCSCPPEQRVPRVTGAIMGYASVISWEQLLPLLSARHTPIVRQPRDFDIEAMTVPLQIIEMRGFNENRALSGGFYIHRHIGTVDLHDGVLDDCDVYAQVHLDNKMDVLEPRKEYNDLGFLGLILGCEDSAGILVLKPAEGGGCERVGVVNISSGSEFVGEIRELKLMPDGENSPLMRHWYTADGGYRSKTCTVFGIGQIVAVADSSRPTAVKTWRFNEQVMQVVLR